ncbi:PEP-CTERM sorting domain-containing protein [Luteolibacter soli]|uniref:PEP-CTERM sorting domain-containing protein n=1 Tax=Luteolibacter soli TaxID=3135280 RepID=A0ABU9AZI2_9BACT
MRLHPAVQAAAAFLLFAVAQATAVTINWGSPVLSSTVNSQGQEIDSSYHVELGAFANGFVPTEQNMSEWASNWRTFSVATYVAEFGSFTGTADLVAGGASSDPMASLGMNFSDVEAYVWIFNSATMSANTEWFLGRSDSWVMPTAPLETDCCDDRLPTQWSISDLRPGDTPVYGGQGQVAGAGSASNPGNYDIQTYTVPETSSLLLASVGLLFTFWRRRPVS